MANEFYTFIVVPHAKARFRKFQVSVRLTKWVLGTTAALGVALVALLAHYAWISVQVIELKRLRTENRALATKAQAYEQNAAKLQAKVLCSAEHRDQARNDGRSREEPARSAASAEWAGSPASRPPPPRSTSPSR